MNTLILKHKEPKPNCNSTKQITTKQCFRFFVFVVEN